MRWQKALWDAVAKCDVDLIKDILSLEKVQKYLKSQEQLYYDEEAPLHLAAYQGHNDLIELMVKMGMDIDSFNVYSDKSGYKITPLHWAVYKNKVGAVRLLLELGADPSLSGKWGKVTGTPLDFAKQKNHNEIMAILKEYEDLSEYESEGDGCDDSDEEDVATVVQRLRSLELQRNALKKELKRTEKEIQHFRRKVSQQQVKDDSSSVCNTKVLQEYSITTCPVCMNTPRHKAFSCRECDNLICNGCLSKVESCPFCRTRYEENPPRRNRWAEKVIHLEHLNHQKVHFSENEDCNDDKG